jgi:hypothetical protein
MWGPLGSGCGPKRNGLRATASACAIAICVAAPAAAQGLSPKPDNAARAGRGAIVSYEERPGANVVYHEATGGMASSLPAPVSARRDQPAAAPAKANGSSEPAKGKASAATRVASKR